MDSNNKAIFTRRLALLFLVLTLPLEAQEAPGKEPLAAEEQPAEGSVQTETGEQPLPDDFKPSEEISEDFPVPLPSDI